MLSIGLDLSRRERYVSKKRGYGKNGMAKHMLLFLGSASPSSSPFSFPISGGRGLHLVLVRGSLERAPVRKGGLQV